jgi:hypothetical protein
MNQLQQAIQELRALNEPVPKPIPLPTEADVAEAERNLGIKFQPDYRAYLLTASDVVLGALEPATITEPESHTYLGGVINDARSSGVPESLFPFCEDNADFYCLSPDGEVLFWSHNGATDERWPSLAAWIQQVWVGENA